MSKVAMKGMAMRGVVSCVPPQKVDNERDFPWFEPAEIRKITAMVGVKSRRIADAETCTSDLCRAAGSRLLQKLGWDPQSVDGLILTTQTPDYVMPPSSCLLQTWLGLPESCATLDVSLGCSAYVYGLWLANALLASGACRRLLFMAGDTPSKYINPKDRATALIFGDAGTATALEFIEDSNLCAHHVMRTDGTGAADLIVPGGSFRHRFPEERSECYVRMDGGHIFDFTRFRIPELLKEMLAFAGKGADDYDSFVFHQANEYLIRFVASQCGIATAKVPIFLREFGNTGAASIPLTLALAELPDVDKDPVDVMFLGFGVGLSWGAVSMKIPRDCVFEHLEYERPRIN